MTHNGLNYYELLITYWWANPSSTEVIRPFQADSGPDLSYRTPMRLKFIILERIITIKPDFYRGSSKKSLKAYPFRRTAYRLIQLWTVQVNISNFLLAFYQSQNIKLYGIALTCQILQAFFKHDFKIWTLSTGSSLEYNISTTIEYGEKIPKDSKVSIKIFHTTKNLPMGLMSKWMNLLMASLSGRWVGGGFVRSQKNDGVEEVIFHAPILELLKI